MERILQLKKSFDIFKVPRRSCFYENIWIYIPLDLGMWISLSAIKANGGMKVWVEHRTSERKFANYTNKKELPDEVGLAVYIL